ncbi:MAG: Mur ligase family protein, partial [Rubricoccaceae bacterium]|nr:Mur ligase family protein [Rubricoccaceae bacterium]
YFDKRPKMLLYRPEIGVVTSMEFDHADIYADWDDYQDAFRRFARLVPDSGLLLLNGDAEPVRALADETDAEVCCVGHGEGNDVTAQNVRADEGGQRFEVVAGEEPPFEVVLPLGGAHNRFNALAVAALALHEGIAPADIAEAFASFKGMKRRQEVRGERGGVLVVDDFAHHPTAVAGTLRGVRERWQGRLGGGRLLAVFEPRSNSSRRKLFEAPYGEAFDAADRVFLSAPPLRHNDDPADFLDIEAVAAVVRNRGTPAEAFEGAGALLPALLDAARPGDLVLVMSNGSFDGLVAKLLDALDARAPVAS